jgi:hypothetical protein
MNVPSFAWFLLIALIIIVILFLVGHPVTIN